MPVALVTIEKEAAGLTPWVNTWGVAVVNTTGRITTNAQIEQVVGDIDFAGNIDTQTNPLDPGYVNASTGASILAAIIGFERLMHYTAVSFKRAYISDGKTKQRGVPGPSGVFASINLQGLGLRSLSGEVPAPASIVLGINRQPLTFSVRSGLLMLRLSLNVNDVTFGDDDGVRFVSTGAEAGYITRIQTALATSSLGGAFGEVETGAWNDTVLAIPQYVGPNDPGVPGSIVGGSYMAGMTLREAMSRQKKRGRKRSTPSS